MLTFKRLSYDTALSVNPISFGALMQLVTPRSVLLGTDFPFVPEPGMKATIAGLRSWALTKPLCEPSKVRTRQRCFRDLGRQLDPVTFAVRYLLTEAATGRMRMLDFLICNRELPPNPSQASVVKRAGNECPTGVGSCPQNT